jgi:hypothetical protein
MNPLFVTNALLAIIAEILLFKFFPTVAVIVLVAGVVWFLRLLIKWERERRQIIRNHEQATADAARQKQQAIADEPVYKEFLVQYTAVQNKWDPERKWRETKDQPQGYQDELSQLSERYKDVLVRRFGPSVLQSETAK